MKLAGKSISLPLVGLTLINVAAASVVLVGLTTTRAQAAPEPTTTIRAERLELVDKTGQVRGQFFVEENGEAVFRMRDQQGQIRVKLGASGRGSGFILMDDQTEPAVQMLAGVSALTNKRDTNVTLRDGAASKTLTAKN
ncbi:MAG: hypothetical protein Q8R02_06325 [Hyphomonadaceae bacterium]|nr:hypothetical protein [Hyphomonadaceae bacterium]